MRLRGPSAVAAAVAIAAAIAAAGVAANLHLLEPHGGTPETVVLGTTIDRSSTTTTTVSPPTTAAPTTTTTTAGEPLRRSYAVGGAGTVTLVVRSGALAVESVVPTAGWRYEIDDQRPDEVEITFRSGEDAKASFHASVQGGDVRVEIEPEEGESPDD